MEKQQFRDFTLSEYFFRLEITDRTYDNANSITTTMSVKNGSFIDFAYPPDGTITEETKVYVPISVVNTGLVVTMFILMVISPIIGIVLYAKCQKEAKFILSQSTSNVVYSDNAISQEQS